MLMANGLAIIAQSFPTNERGKAIGLQGAVLGVGLAGGPAIGGFILDTLGWQALFYTRLPIGLLGMAIAWKYLPRASKQKEPLNLDYIGAITLFVGMAVFLLMLSQSSSLGFWSPLILSMAGVSIVLIATFVLVENRTAQPLIEMALFKIRQFRLFLFLHVLHYIIVGAVVFLVPFYLMNGLGHSATKTGLFITAFFVLRLPFAPISGWLSDRFGFSPLSIAGLSLAVLGTFILSRLGGGASDWAIAFSLIFAGLGSSMFEPTNSSGIMGALRQRQLGIASAAISMGRQIGLATGTTLGGAIFILREQVHSASLQVQGVAEEVAASMSVVRGFGDAMLIIVVLVAIGLLTPIIDRGSKKKASKVESE
jgi:MFS family permease